MIGLFNNVEAPPFEAQVRINVGNLYTRLQSARPQDAPKWWELSVGFASPKPIQSVADLVRFKWSLHL